MMGAAFLTGAGMNTYHLVTGKMFWLPALLLASRIPVLIIPILHALHLLKLFGLWGTLVLIMQKIKQCGLLSGMVSSLKTLCWNQESDLKLAESLSFQMKDTWLFK